MLTNLGLFLATTDLQKYTAVFVLLLFCVYVVGKLFIFQIFGKKNPFNKLLLLYERKKEQTSAFKQTNKQKGLYSSFMHFFFINT